MKFKKASWVIASAVSLMSVSAFGDANVGLMVGESGGEKEIAGVVSGAEINLPGTRVTVGGRQANEYAHANLRLELGTGFGAAGDLNMSQDSLALRSKSGIVRVHAGIEPINLHFSANTNKNRTDYFEWQPMAALGLQLGSESCSIMAVARAGAAIGTLGENGVRAAYGGGALSSCGGFRAAGEVTRIRSDRQPADIGSIDLAFGRKIAVGLRGEAVVVSSDEKALAESLGEKGRGTEEVRGLVTVGGAF